MPKPKPSIGWIISFPSRFYDDLVLHRTVATNAKMRIKKIEMESIPVYDSSKSVLLSNTTPPTVSNYHLSSIILLSSTHHYHLILPTSHLPSILKTGWRAGNSWKATSRWWKRSQEVSQKNMIILYYINNNDDDDADAASIMSCHILFAKWVKNEFSEWPISNTDKNHQPRTKALGMGLQKRRDSWCAFHFTWIASLERIFHWEEKNLGRKLIFDWSSFVTPGSKSLLDRKSW
jgi:hypothetical protein